MAEIELTEAVSYVEGQLTEELKLRVEVLEKQVEAMQSELRLFRRKFRSVDPTKQDVNLEDEIERALLRVLDNQDWRMIRFDQTRRSKPEPPKGNVKATRTRLTEASPSPRPRDKYLDREARYKKKEPIPTETSSEESEDVQRPPLRKRSRRKRLHTEDQPPIDKTGKKKREAENPLYLRDEHDAYSDSNQDRACKKEPGPVDAGTNPRARTINGFTGFTRSRLSPQQNHVDLPDLPVSGLWVLEDLDKNVRSNKDYYKALYAILERKSSEDPPKAVSNMMQKLLTDELAKGFSWLGNQGNAVFSKFIFKDIITDVLENTNGLQQEVNDEMLSRWMMKYFRNAKSRLNMKKNRSTIKN